MYTKLAVLRYARRKTYQESMIHRRWGHHPTRPRRLDRGRDTGDLSLHPLPSASRPPVHSAVHQLFYKSE